MQIALLRSGVAVSAEEYDKGLHGEHIYCIDSSCRAPVHYVKESGKVAFFKTSGKLNSVHTEACAFARRLDFEKTMEKVEDVKRHVGPIADPVVVRFNFDKIDPDYIKRERAERGGSEEVSAKNISIPSEKTNAPKTISSLKTLKKLIMSVEFDLLATIEVRHKGQQTSLSNLIFSCERAHQHVYAGGDLSTPYIVYGTVTAVVRLSKVWYINMHDGDFYFTLVIFEAYFDKFKFKDEDLLDRRILVVGKLKKNEFHKGKKATEIIVKSDEYIEFLED